MGEGGVGGGVFWSLVIVVSVEWEMATDWKDAAWKQEGAHFHSIISARWPADDVTQDLTGA